MFGCPLGHKRRENDIPKGEGPMKRKLAVFFPGRRYGVDCPLLYYAESVCRGKGYDTLLMHYSEHRDVRDMISIDDNIRQTLPYVKERIKEKDPGQYDEMLFVSKSIGTVAAGWLNQELGKDMPPIRHIFMTPLEQTFPYMDSPRNIVICGDRDQYLAEEELKNFCREHGVQRFCFEGVGHSLEHDNMKDTLKTMGEIMEIVEKFA